MSDLRFNGGSAAELAFEGGAEFPGAADEDSRALLRDAVPLILPVDERELRGFAGEALHLVDLNFERVAVVGILRAGLDAHAEAFLVGDGEAESNAALLPLAAFGSLRVPSSDS